MLSAKRLDEIGCMLSEFEQLVVDARNLVREPSLIRELYDEVLRLRGGSWRAGVEVTVRRADGAVLAVNNRRWGGFSCPGGKVEPGETPEAAARRELLEETGCEAEWLRCVGGMIHSPAPRDDDPRRWFCVGFEAGIGDQQPRASERGTEPFWTTPEVLMKDSLYPAWYQWLFRMIDAVPPQRPTGPCKRVRIAVAVDAEGNHGSAGTGCDDDETHQAAIDAYEAALGYRVEPRHVVWLEASVPLPPIPPVVEGEVLP